MRTFGHTGDLGDIIYALPSMRDLGGGVLVLYDERGTREPMTEARFRNIKPLLMAQPYIQDVEYGRRSQPHDYEFRPFRARYRSGANLARMQAEEVGADPDLSQPWLTVPKAKEPLDLVVINRSARYNNVAFDWNTIMEALGDKAIFVGTAQEHAVFEARWGPILYYPTANLLEVAKVIASSRGFVGNQSCCNAIAEALKVNKCLERAPGNSDCLFP